MTYLLILISLFAIWQWHRKRVWKRRYDAMNSQYAQQAVNAFSQMFADAYKQTVADEWPSEIDEHIH